MSSIIRKIMIFNVLIICVCELYAQKDSVILNIKKSDIKKILFPCELINNCIDSIYKHEDTLYIILQDTRKFYQDSNRSLFIVETSGYRYRGNNHNLNVLIQDEGIFDFIILKTFDFVCIFQKCKKKYKCVLIEERADYSNKKNYDLKDSDIKFRR